MADDEDFSLDVDVVIANELIGVTEYFHDKGITESSSLQMLLLSYAIMRAGGLSGE